MIQRRSMLLSLMSVAVAAAAPVSLAVAQESKRKIAWRNWSGSQQCFPKVRKAPADVSQLQELIASAQGIVRPVGAGHSFTGLVPTDDTIVSLSRLSGLIDHDRENLQASFWAGTRLGEIGAPLEAVGQAMQNMPDIDEQALAGCLSTATHGTGANIGCLSSFVEELQLVTASGELLDCSSEKNSDVFEAAKVSLGALGVITKARIQNQAPYRLKRETVWREFDEIMELAEQMADGNRNFEYYYVPFTGMGWTDVHNETDEPISSTERLDANDGAQDLKLARDWLSFSPKLRELLLSTYMGTIDDEVVIESSWKNYASERNVRFNEMEYHLPREHGRAAMQEIRAALEKNHNEVFFPIEVRYVKADDLWLSPFYQRDTCSIAVHRFFEEDFKPYFKTIEPIFRKYNGRPHWGKLNNVSTKEFRSMYPKWQDFLTVRQELDPNGKFLNKYLASLFG